MNLTAIGTLNLIRKEILNEAKLGKERDLYSSKFYCNKKNKVVALMSTEHLSEEIKSLIDMINSQFKQFVIFKEHLSIDEMMVKYYGKHSMKQCILSKLIRFGFKLWPLCGEDGYCFKFSLYTGKNEKKDEPGTRVVQNCRTKSVFIHQNNGHGDIKLMFVI